MPSLPLLWLTGCIPQLPDLDDPCGPWPEAGLYRVTIDVDQTRKPYVYVPSTEAGPRDVVVLLHGAGATGPKFEEITQFETAADNKGFVLVYPNGLGWPLRTWNASEGFESDADDVGFLDELSRQVTDKVCGRRVLATGFSNGAMMIHRWGCEGKVPPDAIVASSGPLMQNACPRALPTPVRHYHGTKDTIVPFEGGEGTSGKGIVFPPLIETMETWGEINQCSDAEPVTTSQGDTECAAWHCLVPTELCLVHGWPHLWPGGIRSDGTDADLTSAAWEFFDSAVPVDEPTDELAPEDEL
jgi:polyhydroxybutyrate depolymerase